MCSKQCKVGVHHDTLSLIMAEHADRVSFDRSQDPLKTPAVTSEEKKSFLQTNTQVSTTRITNHMKYILNCKFIRYREKIF